MLHYSKLVAIVVAMAVLSSAGQLSAQSGGRGQQGSGTQGSQGSGNQGSGTQRSNTIALGGYCAVCVLEMNQWVKGSAEHSVQYDGKTYLFPSADQKKMFTDNPAKYVPALGGDCTVCLAKMGKRVPGTVYHSVKHKGRLYLFPEESQKKMFLDDPAAYENVDLAMRGNCVVCKIEMNKDMPGKPEFTVIHGGLRYLFPSEEQMRMFAANPAKYTGGRIGSMP